MMLVVERSAPPKLRTPPEIGTGVLLAGKQSLTIFEEDGPGNTVYK